MKEEIKKKKWRGKYVCVMKTKEAFNVCKTLKLNSPINYANGDFKSPPGEFFSSPIDGLGNPNLIAASRFYNTTHTECTDRFLIETISPRIIEIPIGSLLLL